MLEIAGVVYELPLVKEEVDEPPCHRCPAICCQYFALEIDKPKSKSDFDQIRWYLMHENTHVFVDEGAWYVQVWNRCQNLLPDHRCGIYETRPEICRGYGMDEEGLVNCHAVAEEDEEYESVFKSPEQLEHFYQKWYKKRYGKNGKKKGKKKKRK